MQTSNAVSTIFRCMSCSFGTRSQTAYAEHIKHCNKEPESETLADDKQDLEDFALPAKKRNSYICSRCSVYTGSLKALLLHLRDVHESDSPIFICRCCSGYAATTAAKVIRHAKRQHLEGVLKGGKIYKQLFGKTAAKKEHAEEDEVSVDNHHLLSSDASPGSTPANQPVKSSSSLGLHLLGRKFAFSDFGHYAFVCQLCGFSHVSGPVVVKHIWQEHRDKLSDVTAEADTMAVCDEAAVSGVLYKCDDCPYSTQTRRYLFTHCSSHRFDDGPARCRYCSFSALNDMAIFNHMKRCHGLQQPSGAKLTPSTSQAQSTCTEAPGLDRGTKKNRKNRCHKVYAKCRTVRKYSCPCCGFKTSWERSLLRHKRNVHGHSANVTESAVESHTHSHKWRQKKSELVSPAAKTKQSQSEELKPVSKTLSSDATAGSELVKLGVYECDICLKKCNSWRSLNRHKEAHMNLRRFKCSMCGLRGNYLSNMHKHVDSLHRGKKAWVITLSFADAKATIEAYKKQTPPLSSSLEKRELSSQAETQSRLASLGVSDSSKALHTDSSSPMQAKSSEHTPPKQKRLSPTKSPDVTETGEGIGIRRLKNYYMCSVCKRRSDHNSSIHRHIRSVHGGRAKLIIKSKVNYAATARQQSCQGTNKQKLNNASEKNCQKVVAQDVAGNMEQNDNVLSSAVSARDSASAQSMISPKNASFVCDVCPYRTDIKRSLAGHRRFHVKQRGCTFECNICPYFVRTPGNLKRHMRLHGVQQSTNGVRTDYKPDRNSRYFCELCPFKTHRRAASIYHKQLHRPRVAAPYKCKRCPFWAPCASALRSHMRLHTAAAEALETCAKNNPETQVSNSFANDVEVASQKHAVAASLNSEAEDISVSPVKNVGNSAVGKASEVIQNKSVNCSDKSDDNPSRALPTTELNADISVSSTVSRHMPSWFCDRCPYSATTLPCFKRHEWLHGKHYQYECCYCDYSVQSYWQLVSHVLWHFEPNRHLLYAQSVSNLDSVPSQLPNCESIRDPVASINRFIPSFENSDVFLLSDESNFQCHCCPYTVEQRSEFFAHMICHCVRAGYGCPYCTFHADVSEKLTAHVFLHFNLPGCRQSAVPPNVCHSPAWKQLDAKIEAIAEKHGCSGELPDEQKDSMKCSDMAEPGIESVLLLKTDVCDDATNMPETGLSEIDDKRSVAVSMVCDKTEDEDSLRTVQQAAGISGACDFSEPADVKHACATASAELQPSDLMLAKTHSANCCQYCDRIIDGSDMLAKHISSHLVGFSQVVTQP